MNITKTVTKTKVKKPRRKPKIQALTITKKKNNTTLKKMRSSLASRVGLVDTASSVGTEQLLQSLFSGISGLHRGLAQGTQLTALCRFKQVLDIIIPAGTYCTYAWAPDAAQYDSTFRYSLATSATYTGIQSPWTSATGYTSTGFAGPFNATNPSTSFRIVRAAMRITPTNNVVNMGGVSVHAYVSDAYIGPPSAANLASLSSTEWSESNFEQYEMLTTYDGTQHIMLQWFPNDDEIRVEPATPATQPNSGFYGYIQAPSTTSTTYHLEFDYGIEYTPTLSYRPFVERQAPTTNQNAYYFLNLFANKYWNEAVITTVQQYEKFVSAIEHTMLPFTNSYQMSNQVTNPKIPAMRRIEREAYIQEEGMCDYITDKTGYDVCGIASDSLGDMAKTTGKVLLDAITMGQRPYRPPLRM
jgi:hypothetical protein